MKYSLVPLLALTATLCGCVGQSVRGGFSPIQGPLAKHSPLPTYTATMSGVLSGTITVVLGTGEVCTGPWAFVSKAPSGTTMHVDFSNENNKPGNTKGVAQDNNGNVFKVSVYN